MRRGARAVSWAASGWLVTLAGCGGAAPPEGPAAGGRIASVAQRERDGLETRWWLVEESASTVGAALAQFAMPALPEDESLRERWRRSGLRLVRVPGDRWEQVERALPAIGTRASKSAGWSPQWIEVFRGRRLGEAPVMVDGQRTIPPTGVFRVLARCWLAAGAGGAERPGARLELAFQVLAKRRAGLTELPSESPGEAEAQAGVTFRDLTLETELAPGFVYVLTADDPGADWSADADDAGERPRASLEESAGPRGEGDAAFPLEELIAGPPASLPLTLGEAAMTASAQQTGASAGRAVLVLRVRSPERFTLLP